MTTREAILKIVDAYKISKGYEKSSLKWKAWDKANYGRAAKAAKSTLEAFEGDVERAVFFVLAKAEEWDEKNLSWTLETISRHAWDDGARFVKEGVSGLESKPVVKDSLLGYAKPTSITSTGDLAKFILQERDKELCASGSGGLERP